MESLNFFRGLGSVARRFGLEEAALLDSMVFWWRTNKANGRNFRDGRWWTFNSVKALSEIFPWWSEKQVRRILTSCVEQGALMEGAYNTEPRDRTKWYSPGDELLALYGEAETGNCICPDGQMDLPERAESSAQMGKPLPCKYHEVPHDKPPKAPQGGRRSGRYELTEEAKILLRAYVGEDKELHRTLGAFMDLRKDMRAVNSGRAVKLLLARLDEYSGGSRENKLALINQSIVNSWKGIFPLRWAADQGKPTAPAEPPAPRPYHLEMIDGEEVVVYDG